MEIRPIAHFKSPLQEKFGLPRQSGLVEELKGEIVFEEEFRNPDALRGIEGFDYLWLIWEFNLNGGVSKSLTVRPPRLGGNEKIGVFASRSPFRPNSLGLSSVKLERVDMKTCTLFVSGADLADGTPIFDIKPYVEYCDSHREIRSGFVDGKEWKTLDVECSETLCCEIENALGNEGKKALFGVLSQDPRPQYHNDPAKSYGLEFAGHNVRFHVNEKRVVIDSFGY